MKTRFPILCMFVFFPFSGIWAQVSFGNNQEKLPTTRDPSYVPPLVSEELQLGQEASSALVIFGEGDGLASYMRSQREAKLKEKRETSRFREREDERMLKQGYKQTLLEQILSEQFGADGFPATMGRYPYSESSARRFSVIFLLALPITGGLSFGGIALYKSASGQTGGFSNTESIVGGLLSIGAALGVAVYDYRRVARLRESGVPTWPPPLQTRDGLIDEEESDLPRSDTQGLYVPPYQDPMRNESKTPRFFSFTFVLPLSY